MQVQSKQKTTTAALRQRLGLTVEQFAALIEKSTSAVNSLETGRLGLSEETASRISKETGVALKWLLSGRPKETPHAWVIPNSPWTKEVFEEIQARKHTPVATAWTTKDVVFRSDPAMQRWLSICSSAEKNGKGELASYLMDRFLDSLAERFGTDDAGASRLWKTSKRVKWTKT